MPPLLFWRLIGSHFTAVCKFNESATCLKSTVWEHAAVPAGEGLLLCGGLTHCGRFSSPPNMQCVLSAPYLLSSAVTEVHALARACVFVVSSHQRGGQHNVSYFSLISFSVLRATDRAALDIPIILLSRNVFFGTTRCRKSPKLHLSCRSRLSSPTVWPR